MNKDQFARLTRSRKVKQVPAFAKLSAVCLAQLGLLDGMACRQPV